MNIDRNQILSVYSGIDGKCCCGCSGKHSYPSARREQAGKDRGYEILDKEVNDRVVTRVINLISEDPDAAEKDYGFTAVIGNRLYIAYKG